MRVADGDDGGPLLRMLREQARRDTAELVSRPGCPVYGLAAPRLYPVALSEVQREGRQPGQMRWTLIRLTYGDQAAGPWVSVTSAMMSPGAGPVPGGSRSSGAEALGRLLDALEFDQHGGEQTPDGVRASRERLPAGNALVVRDGPLWAARVLAALPPAAASVVPVLAGRGVPPADVHLEQLPDLRPVIEAQLQATERQLARARALRVPPPAQPGSGPAEGE